MLDDAVLPDLRDALGARNEPDDEGIARHLELGWKRHAWNERHVRRLEAAVGEINRGWRLGRAADADQDNIGVIEILGEMAIVVQHGRGDLRRVQRHR